MQTHTHGHYHGKVLLQLPSQNIGSFKAESRLNTIEKEKMYKKAHLTPVLLYCEIQVLSERL